MAKNGDAAFTITNVVLHGVPYMALVSWTCGRTWSHLGRGPLRPSWFRPRSALLFLAPLLLLAFVEEGLWDWFVWQDHPAIFGAFSIPAGLAAVAVPVLAVPQLTHYVLDAFIWKMGPENGELRLALAPPSPAC